MATISNITNSPPGDHHIGFTVTMAGGRTFRKFITLEALRALVEESSVEDFIVAQLASLARENPNATLSQLRTLIQSTTFKE